MQGLNGRLVGCLTLQQLYSALSIFLGDGFPTNPATAIVKLRIHELTLAP
jgi:hypothetical protein